MDARVADLHSHSCYSDGSDEPAALVRLAHAAGLHALALTDHDTVAGLAEAQVASAACGLELIPGIELSCTDGVHDIHLLAFWLDAENAELLAALRSRHAQRLQRLDAIIARLGERGIVLTREAVLQQAGRGSIGRPHIAKALIQHGAVATMEEAFRRFLGDDAPCYVQNNELSSAEAIRLVRQAGGVPVVAHPVYLRDDTVIERLCAEGLAGVEAFHGSHAPSTAQRYVALARRLGLLVSGGSDYHGTNKTEGVPLGGARLPYEHVEALRVWKAAHTPVA